MESLQVTMSQHDLLISTQFSNKHSINMHFYVTLLFFFMDYL